jgi:hypothetical protein
MSWDIEFLASAFRHGYTEDDAYTVLAQPLPNPLEEGPGEIGWRVLFLGFNNSLELLEVLIEYCEDDREICFHIAKATKENQRRYERD